MNIRLARTARSHLWPQTGSRVQARHHRSRQRSSPHQQGPRGTALAGRESWLTPGWLAKYTPGLNGEGAEAGRSLPHDLIRWDGLTDQPRSKPNGCEARNVARL